MTPPPGFSDRIRVDGKFFRQGESKFYIKGVTYGPFAPNPDAEPFPTPAQVEADFQQLLALGANLLRVYYVPPRWLLDQAAAHGLKILVDLPWPKHLCFMDSPELQRQARQVVRDATQSCRDSSALFAISVVNEIPAEIVRWSGSRRVEAFIDQLVREVKAIEPDCLCTFTNFPPTEFLCPTQIDFLSFNVYLHQPEAFGKYLAHLQTLADNKPLVLAEFGMDSLREGEQRQAEFLSWQIESTFRGGAAGSIVFSFTDDWFRGGMQIEDWAFGLTTRNRQAKQSFATVHKVFSVAPYFPLPRWPKVSVVVASYNGGRTLTACLHSLGQLNYPDYEIILVDDGSTDNTPEIATKFPNVRTIRQDNRGLSAARNAGLAAATGEVIAYTDSDCRADPDWLYYLVNDLLRNDFVGIGGHNFLPPEDSPVAAAVMVSPGGPSHVMLGDQLAEHIPGCNMAFYKWALEQIGGFDPVFRKAGDDVDVCWRLQQWGYNIGFSAAGFVWHYRRSTVNAYIAQQRGYGEAEALLSRKHPEKFNAIGHSIWHGRIYSASKIGIILQRSIIYHGQFGSGFFQKLYAPAPSLAVMLCTSLEYHLLVTGPLFVLSGIFPVLLTLALTSISLSLCVCAIAAVQARLAPEKRRFWSRPLIAMLFFLQPVARGLARYRTGLNARFGTRSLPLRHRPAPTKGPLDELVFWSDGHTDRYAFISAILARLQQERWPIRADSGWTDHDLEIQGSPWVRLHLTTVSEDLDAGKKNIRCRLQPRWTIQTQILFFSLVAIDLLVIRFLATIQPLIWIVLMIIPTVFWRLEGLEARLLRAFGCFIDETATTSLKLVKLDTHA